MYAVSINKVDVIAICSMNCNIISNANYNQLLIYIITDLKLWEIQFLEFQ